MTRWRGARGDSGPLEMVILLPAVLLLFGVTLLTALVLAQYRFSLADLYASVATRYGAAGEGGLSIERARGTMPLIPT